MILLGVPVLAAAFLLVEAGLEHLRAPKYLARVRMSSNSTVTRM